MSDPILGPEAPAWARKILHRYATDKTKRLTHSIKAREKVRQAIERGEVPEDNYRYRWLDEASNDVVDALIVISRRFNEKYPHDVVSTIDLVDILNTTIARLRKVAD